MNTKEIWQLLEKRYPSSEYALLAEVRDRAGFNASRAADAIVMNLWPSRGLLMYGLEIKVSRTDWLREMKQPEKAENIFKFCDKWYLVTADPSVVLKPEQEIPATWGYMTIIKGKLQTIKEAPLLSPKPIDRDFLAALLKRATQGMVPVSSIEERIAAAAERGSEYQKQEVKRLKEDVAKLEELLQSFERASGIRLNTWSGGKKVGEAVNFVINGGTGKMKREVSKIYDNMRFLVSQAEQIVTALEEAEGLEERETQTKIENELNT